MVPPWADQLLPQLLMEQFYTFPKQCRHIEHMLEGVYNFCLPQILLKSSFQNLGLTVRGVSNKHCLLTFFIRTLFCQFLSGGLRQVLLYMSLALKCFTIFLYNDGLSSTMEWGEILIKCRPYICLSILLKTPSPILPQTLQQLSVVGVQMYPNL